MSCSRTVLMPFPHFSSQQNLEVALTHHCFACLLSKASHKAKLDVSGTEKGTTNILNNTICQVSSLLISVITSIKTFQPHLFFYLFCPSLTKFLSSQEQQHPMIFFFFFRGEMLFISCLSMAVLVAISGNFFL